jgi:hypothetical protein
MSALVFLALTVDSHRKIPALTNAAAIDAAVIAARTCGTGITASTAIRS